VNECGKGLEPVFRANWRNAAFFNFAVEAEKLQPSVPYPLDLYGGKAWVSLVAFETSDIWFDRLGRWTRFLVNPFGKHRFLNVRTYIENGDTHGIYFLTEFVNRRIAIPLASGLYHLPYRYAKIDYCCDLPRGNFKGDVGSNILQFEGSWKGKPGFAKDGSLEAFLVERYVAGLDREKQFRIEHDPWPLFDLELSAFHLDCGEGDLPWLEEGEFVGAYFTKGVDHVGIGGAEAFGLNLGQELKCKKAEAA